MPNVTIQEILAAIKTIVEAVDDVGTVLTSERHVTDEHWVRLFTGLNGANPPQGVMILFQEFAEQTKGPRVCTVQQRHRYSLEVIEPYSDEVDGDGQNSYDRFVTKLQAINDALNLVEGTAQPWNLGVTYPGSDVEHQFLQSDGPMAVRIWGNGSNAAKTHYASYTLDVLCVVSVHA
jgi:hypothetical protein